MRTFLTAVWQWLIPFVKLGPYWLPDGRCGHCHNREGYRDSHCDICFDGWR